MKFTHPLSNSLYNAFRKRPNQRTSQKVELQFEKLEPRQMLVGDLVFSANFEDVEVPAGTYAFFSEVSGLTATESPVEIQNNHPAVGPASEGKNLLELDGTNGVFVNLDNVPTDGLLLQGDYSPRRGYDQIQNEIEVLWNGSIIGTLAENGKGNRSTEFEQFEFTLPGSPTQTTGRLEFRSTTENDTLAVGGLLDDIKVFEFDSIDLPPKLTPVSDQTVNEGQLLSVQFSATDPDSNQNQLRFSLDRAPAGATVDPVTGLFRWTPNSAAGGLRFPVDFRVTDESGLSDTQSFRISVNDVVASQPPKLDAIPDQTIDERQTLNVQVTATDADSSQSQLRYSMMRAPVGSTLDPMTGVFQWTPNSFAGGLRFPVDVVVTDETGLTDSLTFRINVNDVAASQPPELMVPSEQTVDEGQTLTVQVSATDPDSAPSQLRFSTVRIPFGSTLDPVTGLFTWTPNSYAGGLRFPVDVVVTDETGLTDAETFWINVNDVTDIAPQLDMIDDQSITELETLSVQITATDFDSDPSQLRFSTLRTPVGSTLDPVTGLFQWTPNRFAGGLRFPVDVVVTDETGLTDEQTFRITVNDIGGSPVLEPIQDQTVKELDTITVQLIASDPDSDPSQLRYDGIRVPVGSTLDPVSGLFQWTPNRYAGGLRFGIDVRVTDETGLSDQKTFRINVENLNVPPVLAPIADQTVVQNSLLTFTATATDEDRPNEQLKFGLTGSVPSGASIDPITGEFTWTPMMDSPAGLYTFNVVVVDTNGNRDSQAVNVNVTSGGDEIVLVEASRFETEAERLIPITKDTKQLSFNYAAFFDLDDVDFINDAFEVALLDSDGNSLVHTIDAQRDAYFNLTEGELFSHGVNTEVDGSTVKLDLSHIAGGTTARLVFRLVNNDADTQSRVRITGLGTTEAELDTPIGASFAARPEEARLETDFVALTDVTGSFQIDYGKSSFDAESATLFADIKATNLANHPIDGPFVMIVHSISDPNVVLVGAAGTTPAGDRYYLLDDSTGLGTIASGASTLTETLEFFNPGGVQFSYRLSILAQPNTAPEFVSQPNREGEAGVPYTYDANATDADNDKLSYKLMAAPAGLSIDNETGLIAWVPEMENLGTHSVIIEVADGRGGEDMQQFDIEIVEDRPNRPPVIISTPVVEALISAELDPSYEYQVIAVDPDVDPIGYELTEAPAGMQIDPTSGLIEWIPTGDQVGLHTVVVTADDGRGGTATQEYQLRVLADPTNTSPVIISEPVDDLFVPGFSNPSFGAVSPQRISLDLGNGETFEGTVSITLPETAARFADIVLAVDESGSMGGDQAWVGEMVPLLDAALIAEGIGSTPEFPNRFAIVGFGGGLDGITVGHFLNSQDRTKYTLYGPNNDVLATGNFNDVLPDELLNLDLPADGRYVLVVEAQDNADLIDGIDIGIEGQTGESVRVESLELNTIIEDLILVPGQPVEYQFSLSADTLVYFDTLAKDHRIQWSLDGPNGNIVQNARFDRSIASTLEVYGLSAGDYTITIDSNVDVATDYKFQLLDLNDARPIDSGEIVSDEFELKRETFAYRFTATAGQTFEFENTTTGVHSSSKWRLLNFQGEQVLINNIGTNQAKFHLPTTGEYFLLMESMLSPKEGNSQLRIPSEFEFKTTIEDLAPPTEVLLGAMVEGSIEYVGQFVYYGFTLDQRSLVYLDSLVDSSISWTLTGPRGEVVSNRRFNVSDSIDNSAPVLELLAGDYMLRVNSNGQVGPFAYRVMDLVDAVEIEPGVAFDGELVLPNQTNLYRFDALAGEQYFFDVIAASDAVNSQYKLIDPYGRVTFISNRLNDQPAVTIPSDGTYTLLVEGRRNNVDADTYSMNVVPVSNSQIALTMGDQVDGTLTTPGQLITYTFDLVDNGLLYFDSLTDSGDFNWSLEGPRALEVTNRRFDQSDSANVNIPVLELPAGGYRLTVQSLADTLGDFSFVLYDLLSNASSMAITPNPGSANPAVTITGSNAQSNQTEIFRFTAEPGDEFSFVTTVTGSINSYYRLLDTYGTEIIVDTALTTDRLNQVLIAGGTYYLLVEGRINNADVDDYSIDINWIQNNGPTTYSGVPLVLGTTTSGNLAAADQIDQYTFTLASSSLLYLDALTNNSTVRWTLRGPQGQRITSRSFTGTDSFNNASPVAEFAAGDYQLDVFASSGTPGDYQFRMVDLSSATPITPGTSFSGELDPANETEFYKFDAVAGERLYFDVESVSDVTNTQYKLIDPYGQVVFISNRLYDTGLRDITVSGTHTLLVEGWRGNTDIDTYTMNVHRHPAGMATSLTIGELTSGMIGQPGETVEYSFTLSDRAALYFDSLTNASDLKWTLTGPSGTVVDARRFDYSDSYTNNNAILDLPAGDYSIVIDVDGDLSRDFSFVILDLAGATMIDVGTPVDEKLDQLSGATTPSNSTKLYSFVAEPGDIVYFDGQGIDDGFSTTANWRVIDPYGVQFFNQSLASDFGPRTLAGGTYTVLVEGRIHDTGVNGGFMFEIVPLGNEFTPVTPTELTFGSTIEGETSVIYETDQYSFEVVDQTLAYFDSLTNDSSLVWSLESNGRTIVDSRRFDRSDSSGFLSPAFNLRPGDYILSVFSTQAEPYSFRLLNLEDATTVSIGDTIAGSFTIPNQTDAYKFSSDAGERIFFDVLSTSSASSAYYRVVDQNGRVLFQRTSMYDREVFEIPSTGDYWLLIEAKANQTTTHDYEIQMVSSSVASDALTLGDTVVGSLTNPGDIAEFKFSVGDDRIHYFDSLADASNISWSLSSGKSDLVVNRLFSASDSFNLGNPILDLSPGDYLLTVAGVGDSVGDFSFRLLNLAVATPASLGTTIVGSLDPPNETDVYQFEGVPGQSLLVDVEAASDTVNTYYRVVDPNGVIVGAKNSLADLEPIEMSIPGVYYLLIEGWRANQDVDTYEINLREIKTRDGGAITLGTQVSGSIAIPGEVVEYSIDLTDDTLVHFDSLTNDSNIVWSLKGPRGVEYSNLPFSRSDSFYTNSNTSPSVAFELRLGTYTLTVDGTNGTTGDFEFNLVDLLDDSQSTLLSPEAGSPATAAATQSSPQATDVYRFEANAGDQFSFDSTTTGSISSDYRLLDPYGRLIFSRFSTGDQAATEVAFTGTYYLLVEGRPTNPDPDEYSILITHEGNTPPVGLSGDALTLNVTQAGDLSSESQIDSYTFSLSDRTKLYFDSLTHDSKIRWTLTGPRGVEFNNIRFDLTDYSNSGPVPEYLAGDYQLDVFASTGTPGDYAFRLVDLDSAVAITPGTEFDGELALGNETNFYKFDADAGEQFYFDVVMFSDKNNTRFKLVDAYGQVTFTSNVLNDQDVVTIPRSGTYTLMLEGKINNAGVDTYSMNVIPFVETKAPLVVGGSTNGMVAIPGEELLFEFSLPETQLLYFDPVQSNNQLNWSLANAFVSVVDGKRFDQGIELVELQAGDYTLTVDGVNDFVGDFSFLSYVVSISNQLPTDGSTISSRLDSNDAIQVFQFEGIAGEHFALLPDWNMQFTDSTTAELTSLKYVAAADPEDGYSGIDAAIRADVFREGAAINYILVTDEDRDVQEDNVTFTTLFRELAGTSALLNVVTTAQMLDDTNAVAIGVDSEGTAYIADGMGGFTVGTGGYTTTNNVSFKQDYIDLAWALGGASWSLGLLRSGGVNAESFTNAFIDVKVSEILEQTALRLISSNLAADFEVTAPDGGVFTEIEGGETYDFEVRVGNNGQPISYDLLFTQGQTVGSIPVFIISPYQYGAKAFDDDGDPLEWSIVAGPEGLAIDAATGVLAWPTDEVIYGEHPITIRVDDGRGGFDEQSFVLDVNGGEPASISGRAADLNSTALMTVNAVVPGNANPYLSGMPDGSTASGADVAPDESPAFVDGFLSDLIPGTVMTFAATGGVHYGGEPSPDATPDGLIGNLSGTHANGAENGISNFIAPWDALVGVFLTDSAPSENPAPETLDFSGDGNVVDGINYTSLAPELQQLFFIGDGVNDDGDVQEITIPEGATRLFLGTTDGFGWYNNLGFFSVEVTAQQYVAPQDVEFTVFLDSNRNGLLDETERFETTDEDGDFTFTNVAAGSFVVAQQPLEGWRQQTPGFGAFELSVDPGESVDDLFFGNIEVPLVNTNPIITSQPIQNAVAGEPYRYTPTIEELDGDAIEFDLPLAPGGMAMNPANGAIYWTPGQHQIGTQNVLLRVRDANGGYDLQYFQIAVAEPNTAPVITSTPPTGPAGVGLPFTYDVNAVDAQEDAIEYSLVQSPEGMTIDSLTGVITWTPTASDVGSQSIAIVALDERGLSSKQTFELAVELNPENVDPMFLSEPPTEVRLADNYLYIVRTLDPNGDPTTLTLDAAPDGMTLDADGLVAWAPGPDQLGSHTVRLSVADGRGGIAVQEFTLEVKTQPVNFPPKITSIPLTAAIAEEAYLFQPTATDANFDTLIWSLETAPLGMTIDAFTGQINWNPQTEDIGPHPVTLQVTDTYGAYSQLVYTLRVRAVNTPPVILSSPPTTGAVGSTYLYQVGAEDVDQDQLTFTLVNAPTGMSVDSQSGLVQWTPAAGQNGAAQVEIRVADSIGASVSQNYTIQVADGQPNELPVITSTPGFFATVGATYTYQITANDPDGDVLTYTLLSSQDGMTVDSATGLLQWTPTTADLGTTFVEIVARDPSLGGSIQQFSLTVLAANNAPVISSTPPTTLASGQPFRYDVLATDADGEFLTYELITGPDGMVIDGLGRMFWIPMSSQIGENSVEVKVTDPRGAFATQAFDLTVAADTTAPLIVVNLSDNPVDVGSMIDINVQAIDNVGVESLLLTVDGVAVPLDSSGNARIELDTVGSFTALATATDAAGNSATDSVDIFVADPNDVDGPVISIAVPGDGDSITAPTDVIGSVMDDTLVSYRLLLAEFGSRNYQEIASGTENVDNDVLGRIDPTLLQNGSYLLRLEAFDAGGNGSVIEQAVEITGELKLGNFQLAFSDLVIPIAGIPIEITRVYDTLQSQEQGDFGYGWRLEYRNTNLRVSLEDTGLENYGIYPAFREGVRVYLNVPGVGRQGFTFTPEYKVLPGFGNNLVLARPRFTADPGNNSTLSVPTSGYLTVNEFGELSASGSVPYNPASPDFGGVYILKTADGLTYRIDGSSGKLDSARDGNGNTVVYSEGGVKSDKAEAIVFTRNAVGNVVSISDLEGEEILYSYNANGELASVVDREGHVTSYGYLTEPIHYLDTVVDPLGREGIRSEYDGEGRLIQLVNVRGAETSFSFDPDNFVTESTITGRTYITEFDTSGNILSTTDQAGNQVRNEYDSGGNLISQTTPLGETTRFVRDSQGNVLEEINPLGYTTRFAYDQAGKVISTSDALGNTAVFEYDSSGNLIAMTDANGQASKFEYDSVGNLIAATDANGGIQRTVFDSFGNAISRVNAVGGRTDFQFNSNGQSTGNSADVLLPSGDVTKFEVIYELDANGNQTRIVSPDGNEVRQEFDPLGRISQVVDQNGRSVEFEENDSQTPGLVILPGGRETSTEYSLSDQPISQTNPNGQTTRYEYDFGGNLVKRILPDETPGDDSDNPFMSFEYDGNQRVVAQIDALGNRTEFEYDAAGNQTIVRDALGRETHKEFNSIGQTTAVIDVLGRRTEMFYDSMSRLVSTRFADGNELTRSYDAVGNLIRLEDALGTVHYRYDLNNQLVGITDANGNETSYELDQFGNVIGQTDALGRETRYEYDEQSRRTATIRPNGERSEIGYTEDNRIAFTTDFAGNRTEHIYDDDGRLSEMVYEDGTSDVFVFDAAGNVLSIRDSNGLFEYEYDSQSRLVSQHNPDSTFLKYEYDNNSNVVSIETPSGVTTYAYDALNQMTGVTAPTGEVTTFEYDEAGNRIAAKYDNGNVESYEHDVLNRLVKIELFSDDNSLILSTSYEYDAVGQVSKIVRSDGSSSQFQYDRGQQLLSEVHVRDGVSRSIEYTYDAVGNRVLKLDSLTGTSAYSYNDNDQLLEIDGFGAATYLYDADGNLMSEDNGNGDQTVYERNSEGELTSVTITVNGVTQEIAYEYDPAGNRISRTDAGGEIRYLIDMNRDYAQTIEEYGTDGVVTTHYLVESEGVFASNNGGEYQILHRDRLNSVYLTSETNGDIVGEYFYDAFGNTLFATNGLQNRIQFTGEYRDAGTDLLYLRARNLDTDIGRFISTDPFDGNSLDPRSLHRYIYAANNPVNLTDPSGETPTLAEMAVYTGIAGLILGIGQQVYAFYQDVKQKVNYAGPALNISVPVGPKADGGFLSAGFGFGFQAALLGTLDAPNEDDPNVFDRSMLAGAVTMLASGTAGGNAFNAIDLPAGGGLGGIEVNVPLIFSPQAPHRLLLGGYLQVGVTISKVVGVTPGAPLFAGFGRGSASGFSIGTQAGLEIGAVSGVTFFVYGDDVSEGTSKFWRNLIPGI